ncbi:MAG: SDR family NAD(P)-dependent oxidoreductase [Muribaculaceae bacterium]|nr:SDR family NAD(P)-dependent oxidoreductase [Muribaculaceae bacterium]
MKRIIIMGASSGIGLELAEMLASRGVRVGLAARHTERLHALKGKYPEVVEYMSIDITHRDAPAKLNELIDKTGGMDIYVHVSGILRDNADLNPQTEAEVVNTNASGFARMLSAAYGYFRDNSRAGQIVAVSSVAGTKGIGRLAAYSASKAFDTGYMVALEQLANSENVDVKLTEILPGWVRTPLLDSDSRYPMEMDAEYVAYRILKAIVERRRRAVIDWRWRMLRSLWRLLPERLWVRMDVALTDD